MLEFVFFYYIGSPKTRCLNWGRGNNKAQREGPKDLITHQRRKHLSNWDRFSSSCAKINSAQVCTHTHEVVYPQQHGGEVTSLMTSVGYSLSATLLNPLPSFRKRDVWKGLFFSLWVAESPSGLREAHSRAVLLHTPVTFTSLYVGSKARDPSVISVGETWNRQRLKRSFSCIS